jgi:glutaredoxin
MDSKVEKLYKKISNDKKEVIFFGLSYCEYCKKTIELLKKKKITYKYYQIDNYYNIFFNVLNEVLKLYPNIGIDPNHKTFPVIFIKKKFIGGYTELNKKLNN